MIARDGHMPPPVNVSIRRSDRIVPGHSLPVVDHSRRTPGVLSDARNDITKTINTPDDNATTRMELTSGSSAASSWQLGHHEMSSISYSLHRPGCC